MQVRSPRHGAPLPADEGGEAARFIVGIRCRGHFPPSPRLLCVHRGQRGPAQIQRGRRRGARVRRFRQQAAELVRCLAGVDGVADGARGVPVNQGIPPPRILRFNAVPIDVPHGAQELGVVGNDQKVQRLVDLQPGAVMRMDDRQALGEAIGGVWIGREIAVHEGVDGIRRVQVSVAPQQQLVLSRQRWLRQREARRQRRDTPARRGSATCPAGGHAFRHPANLRFA